MRRHRFGNERQNKNSRAEYLWRLFSFYDPKIDCRHYVIVQQLERCLLFTLRNDLAQCGSNKKNMFAEM
jgi:hypothetical protein